MSSRKYRSLCLNGQHSGPAGRGGERFFLPVPRAGEYPGRKGPVPLRAGVPGTGMVPLLRHVPAPPATAVPSGPRRTAGAPRPSGRGMAPGACPGGAGAMWKIVSISACCAVPCRDGRRTGGCTAKALQDNCVIFHTKIVSTDMPSHLPFCHDARYSQVPLGAGPE